MVHFLKKLRAYIRTLGLVFLTFVGFIPVLLFFYFPRLHGYSINLFNKALLFCFGAKVRFEGAKITKRPALFLSNHISYFDIFAFSSKCYSVYAPKSDAKKMPIWGFLCGLSKPIWIDRQNKKAIADNMKIFAQRIKNDNVNLYPEGTTTLGVSTKPFKSSLLQFLYEEDAEPVKIQPYAIAMTKLNGKPVTSDEEKRLYAFIEKDGMVPHMWRLLMQNNFEITLKFFEPVLSTDFENRKQLTAHVEKIVSDQVAKFNAE